MISLDKLFSNIRRRRKDSAAESDVLPSVTISKPLEIRFENVHAPRNIEIVVLIPIAPNIERQFVNSAIYLVERAAAPFSLCRLVLDPTGDPPPKGLPHPFRQTALAKIRQDMVDKYLGSANWIAWVDADIVDYPPNLFGELIDRADNGIAAPVVLMDGDLGTGRINSDGFGCGRFFDIAGFVENLHWARFERPWFNQPGPVYKLDSVGACYVVNADIYRQGAKHIPDSYSLEFIRKGLSWTEDTIACNQRITANCFTEHFSVCQWAKKHGYLVCAFEDLIAKHAVPK